jgi:hypothetical protein
MKRILASLALLGALATPSVARADTGYYSTDDGPSCTWQSYTRSSYGIDCSGYSRAAGTYVAYHCDLDVFGSSRSWSCRNINGDTWRGSS